MTPSVVTIRAGTNRPVKFVVPKALVPASATFELVVSWSGGSKVYPVLSAVEVGDNTEITWAYTVADSRLFPIGRRATIEMQWSIGGVQDADAGQLEVLPGSNND